VAKRCETKKLTKHAVESAPLLVDLTPDDKVRQRLYLDTELRGFGLCVGATAKTYFAQRLVGGRSVRVTIGRHGVFTVDQARREAQQILAKMARGENPIVEKRKAAARGFTLRQGLELTEEVLTTKKRSEKTIEGYRYNIETYLSDWLDRPLREITRTDLRERHQKIAADVATGRYANGRARSKGQGQPTANAAVVAFRTIYNRSAEEHADLPVNPVTRFHFFTIKRQHKELQLSRLHLWHERAAEVENPIRRDYLLFTLHTGLRRTSAAVARWEHVDFARRVLRIPSPKGGSERAFDLPLTGYLIRLLKARKKENDEIFEESPWVFPAASESGHIEEPREEFDGVAWTPHDLRRWFITAAESLNLSPYVIKSLVNHSLPGGDVTAGYIQHEVERLRPDMERIGARLIALCKRPTADKRARAH
jgi:integrase